MAEPDVNVACRLLMLPCTCSCLQPLARDDPYTSPRLAGIVGELDEAEALELAGLAIRRQAHVGDLPGVAEQRRERLAHRLLALAAVEALHEHVVVIAGRAYAGARDWLSQLQELSKVIWYENHAAQRARFTQTTSEDYDAQHRRTA